MEQDISLDNLNTWLEKILCYSGISLVAIVSLIVTVFTDCSLSKASVNNGHWTTDYWTQTNIAWMPGQDGFRLIDKIRRTKFVGETGSVILDEDTGTRTNLTFSVLRMTKMGFVPDAVWSESTGYMKSKGKFRQFIKSLFRLSVNKYLISI